MSTKNHHGGYAIVDPNEAEDHYAGSDVPGEFRSLTDALGCSQLAITLIRVPAHSDFEQGTGHFHDEIEELYLVTTGTLTMRFGDDIQQVRAPAVVRVDPRNPAFTPQRGRSDRRDVGHLAQARQPRRHEARRFLGGIARGAAEPGVNQPGAVEAVA
jgi:mannose-6-phosphate isomerase-like protein (cupin superfamily)